MSSLGVKLGRVFENTSKKSGKRYFSGRLGAARIVIMHNDRGENENEWTIFVQDPPPDQKKDEDRDASSFSEGR